MQIDHYYKEKAHIFTKKNDSPISQMFPSWKIRIKKFFLSFEVIKKSKPILRNILWNWEMFVKLGIRFSRVESMQSKHIRWSFSFFFPKYAIEIGSYHKMGAVKENKCNSKKTLSLITESKLKLLRLKETTNHYALPLIFYNCSMY